MKEIRSITQTCGACPSQWEGTMADGSDLYIRYRWGCLRIELDGREVLSKEVGDGLDGVISLDKVLRISGFTLTGDRNDG